MRRRWNYWWRRSCGVVQSVTPPTAVDTAAEWPAMINSLAGDESSQFINTQISAKVLRDGRILYMTVLVR